MNMIREEKKTAGDEATDSQTTHNCIRFLEPAMLKSGGPVLLFNTLCSTSLSYLSHTICLFCLLVWLSAGLSLLSLPPRRVPPPDGLIGCKDGRW